ncbi:MAG: hypothetical protein ACR2K3_04220 [Nocardioides sp.]
MLPTIFFWTFIAFVVVIIALAIVGLVRQKKRREGLAAWAAAKGWTYARHDDGQLRARFDGAPFGTGSSRQASNVLRGTYDGRSMTAFDYQYETTSTDADGHSHSTTHSFSVLVTEVGVPFPGLSVTPEGMITRFFGRITNSDIELESEDLNRAFTVRCSERKFASDVRTPQMMEMLLRWPELAWRFDHGCLLLIGDGEHDIAEVEAKLSLMDMILDRIPSFVWQQWTAHP